MIGRRGAGVMVVALGLLASGCGGSGALSRQEYSSKLNTICKQVNTEQEAIGQPTSPQELVTKGPRLIEVLQRALEDVRDLDPPGELRVAHQAFVEIAEQLNAKLTELVDAVKANDETKAAELTSSIDVLDEQGEAIARTQLGAPSCATRSR